jgi:hypothetical protein
MSEREPFRLVVIGALFSLLVGLGQAAAIGLGHPTPDATADGDEPDAGRD